MSTKSSGSGVQLINVLLRGERSLADENLSKDAYILEFERKNLLAINVPILCFDFKNIDQLAKNLASLKPDDQNGIIITSPRVVRSLQEAVKLSQYSDILQNLASELVFVVGENSAKQCSEKLNLNCNQASASSGNGQVLGKFILNHCANFKNSIRLIYPKSSLGDNTIETMLTNQDNLSIEPIQVYDTRTIENIDEVLIRELRTIKHILHTTKVIMVNLVFFSPSGLNGFMKINQQELTAKISNLFTSHPKAVELRYSCIGKTTEAALKRFGLETYCTATNPTAESLTDSIINKSTME